MKVGDLIRIWPIPLSEGQTMSEKDVKIGLIYEIEKGQMTRGPTPTYIRILIGTRKARIWSSPQSPASKWVLADPIDAYRVTLVEVEKINKA
jgi:hypothetical protein